MTIKLAVSIALLTGFSAAAKADSCATPIECISQALVALDETRAQLRAREEELTQAKDAIKALQDQASGFQGQLNGLAGQAAGVSSQIASVNASVGAIGRKGGCYEMVLNPNFYTFPRSSGFTTMPQRSLPAGVTIDGADGIGPLTNLSCQDGYYLKGLREWNWGSDTTPYLDRAYCCPF